MEYRTLFRNSETDSLPKPGNRLISCIAIEFCQAYKYKTQQYPYMDIKKEEGWSYDQAYHA